MGVKWVYLGYNVGVILLVSGVAAIHAVRTDARLCRRTGDHGDWVRLRQNIKRASLFAAKSVCILYTCMRVHRVNPFSTFRFLKVVENELPRILYLVYTTCTVYVYGIIYQALYHS